MVTALDLTAARLGPSGCQALLEVIRLTLQLRSLCLADNELDDSCVRQLLGTLSGLSPLVVRCWGFPQVVQSNKAIIGVSNCCKNSLPTPTHKKLWPTTSASRVSTFC